MDGNLIKTPVDLRRGSLLRIDDGVGVLMHVWEGEVWLTQEGSEKDHMLVAGQWFRIDRDGATIAHAFKQSRVSLSPPSPARPRRSLRGFLVALIAPRPSAA